MSGHVSGADAAAAEVNSSWGNQLPDMLVSYFRQHGVHSLMLVVCHGDIGELRASTLRFLHRPLPLSG